ncbi:mucin-2-like isoform X1 [Alosa sapidissima]|uniref:mucin-2-like isoform X1 n=1 Tax=Alosa sapidissima TaxID=34773 RepID=UPI001C0973E3|nr:mucin-2-like isoform X1 [Alosa sapidissima]
MKTSIKFTLLSLAVMSCVRCDEITVKGHEGGDAVLNCTYQKSDESFKKYLLKGESKDGVDVILSRKGKVWTHKERVSLQDKKDVNIFTVTIRNLTPEDAGIYWCGVKKYLEDPYTRVNLTVDRKANKPTAAIPTVNAEVTTVTLPNTIPDRKANKPTAAIPTVNAEVTTVTLPNTIPAVISKLTAKVTTVTPPNTPDRKDNKPTAVTADVTIVTLPNTPVSSTNATTRTLSITTERTTHLQSDQKSPTSGVSTHNPTTRTLSNITERTTHLQSDQNQKSPTSGVSNHNATTRTLSNTTESERPTHLQSDQMSPTSSVSTHNATTRPLTNITDSERTESDPTSAASGGHLANLSGGLVVAVVIFALLVVTFRLMKRRAEKKRALPTPLSGNIRPDSCVYSEIQPTSPHDTDGPNQSDQLSSPALTSIYALVTPPAPVPAQHHKAANQLPQPTTASDDIYSLATNLTQALHSGVTSVTNQHEPGPATAATGGDVIYSLATNLMPSLPTRTSVSSTTNQQSDPAIYCNLTSANENPDGSEYATVVFRDEPIGSDSASVSFSKNGASPL